MPGGPGRRCAGRAGRIFGGGEESRADLRTAQLLEVNKVAAKYFYYQLRAPNGGPEGYGVSERTEELSDETMRKFGLGYAGPYSDELYRYLKEKGDFRRTHEGIRTDERK